MRLLALLLILLPMPAVAFERVATRDAFVSLVRGKVLSGPRGVRLQVLSDGRIAGRGFGLAVSGAWAWRDGYFCRTLETALRDFPENCQLVAVSGGTVRFTADRGAGETADLTLAAP